MQTLSMNGSHFAPHPHTLSHSHSENFSLSHRSRETFDFPSSRGIDSFYTSTTTTTAAAASSYTPSANMTTGRQMSRSTQPRFDRQISSDSLHAHAAHTHAHAHDMSKPANANANTSLHYPPPAPVAHRTISAPGGGAGGNGAGSGGRTMSYDVMSNGTSHNNGHTNARDHAGADMSLSSHTSHTCTRETQQQQAHVVPEKRALRPAYSYPYAQRADNSHHHRHATSSFDHQRPPSAATSAYFDPASSSATTSLRSSGEYPPFSSDTASSAKPQPMYRNQRHRKSLSFPGIAFIDGNLVSATDSEGTSHGHHTSQQSMTALSLLQHSRSPSPSRTGTSPSEHSAPPLDGGNNHLQHHRIPSYSTEDLVDDFAGKLSLTSAATVHAQQPSSQVSVACISPRHRTSPLQSTPMTSNDSASLSKPPPPAAIIGLGGFLSTAGGGNTDWRYDPWAESGGRHESGGAIGGNGNSTSDSWEAKGALEPLVPRPASRFGVGGTSDNSAVGTGAAMASEVAAACLSQPVSPARSHLQNFFLPPDDMSLREWGSAQTAGACV